MRPSWLAIAFVAAFLGTADAKHGGKKRCPLVGFGPENPFGATLTSELYTTNLAPTFLERRKVPAAPISSTDQQTPPARLRTGSIPSIVLPPPAPIANPQLAPPQPGPPGSTSSTPAPLTPASMKPSSSSAPNPAPSGQPSISPRRQ